MQNNLLEKLEEINKNLNYNTSYPLSPNDWQKYRKNTDIFKEINDFCMYIHIPFCKHLCNFCEYSKCKKTSLENETKIIDTIINDINNFKKPNMLYGLDIGGGTPTCLDITNFKKIVDLASNIIKQSNKPDDFIASIEATFDTLDDEKINILKNSGFKRISFGLQVLNKNFLQENKRTSYIDTIINTINKIKNDFVINIDIMYGINNITKDDLKNTIDFVKSLNIEQVTVYEMRYNMVNLLPQKTRDEIIDEYDYLYNLILNAGFNGRYGCNTFSKLDDEGVSSYLKYRMDGYFYKGFGPSAQSMTNIGISYNKFKSNINKDDLLSSETFENGDVYELPKNELFAKLVCISLYRCKINIDTIERLYNIKISKEKIKKLGDLIFIKDNNIYITKKGYKYYAAIGKFLYESNMGLF